jgi:hypothetical protein
MSILFATAPSPFIATPNPAVGFRLKTLLDMAAHHFADAQLSKELFDTAAHRVESIAEEMLSTNNLPDKLSTHNRAQRQRREQRLYAREFIFAVDNFIKQLQVLAAEPDAPASIQTAVDTFVATVPGVQDVRNSLHHVEDRVRGLKAGNQPITIQPVRTPSINAASALFIGTGIEGTK